MYNELNVDKDITIGKDGKELFQPNKSTTANKAMSFDIMAFSNNCNFILR